MMGDQHPVRPHNRHTAQAATVERRGEMEQQGNFVGCTDTDSSRYLHPPTSCASQPMLNHDGTAMKDHRGRIVYRSQYLSTHPLRADVKERVGYAGRKLYYVSGEGVIRTMNEAFGHEGWSTDVTRERVVMCEKDDKGRWFIGYLATVRVTLASGVSHEDCGSGEGINESKVKAHEKAMKSAITDAMKRAARHFGERLGNALYVKGNGPKTAPRDNKSALEQLERKDALSLFGDQGGTKGKNGDASGRGAAAVTPSARGPQGSPSEYSSSSSAISDGNERPSSHIPMQYNCPDDHSRRRRASGVARHHQDNLRPSSGGELQNGSFNIQGRELASTSSTPPGFPDSTQQVWTPEASVHGQIVPSNQGTQYQQGLFGPPPTPCYDPLGTKRQPNHSSAESLSDQSLHADTSLKRPYSGTSDQASKRMAVASNPYNNYDRRNAQVT